MRKIIAIVLCMSFFSALVTSCARPGSKEFNAGVLKAIEENPKAVFESITKYAQEEAMNRRRNEADQERVAIEAQFKNPLTPSTDGRPAKGPKNAPITIVEYSDFQCPYCARAFSTVERVMKEYDGKVRLIYKHLPLPFHPESLPAAKASVAAGKQGKFYEYHDELFKNTQKLGKDLYSQLAKKLNLDVEKFKKDMETAETLSLIKEDEAEAQKFDIAGTPGFIINGVALKGAYPFEQFKQIIDRHLGN